MNKILWIVFTAVVIAAAILPAAGAASGSPALHLPGVRVLDQQRVIYRCAGNVRLAVRYLNTDAGSFAYLPVGGTKSLFVSVVAASGVKYVAGPYVWWSKGKQAFLEDVRQPPGSAPVLQDCDALGP